MTGFEPADNNPVPKPGEPNQIALHLDKYIKEQ